MFTNTQKIVFFSSILSVLYCGCSVDANDKKNDSNNNNNSSNENNNSGPSNEARLDAAIQKIEDEGRVFCDNVFQCFPEDQRGSSLGECYVDAASVNKARSKELTTTLVLCLESIAVFNTCISNLSCEKLDAFFAAQNADDLSGSPCEEEFTTTSGLCSSFDTSKEELPELVRVSISGAVVNVTKNTGESWDASIDEDSLASIGQLAGLPYSEVIAALASPAIDSLSKPDPKGSVEVDIGDGFDYETPLNGGTSEDTFIPSWEPAEYADVPLNESIRIRVTVYDEDISNNDSVAVIELNYEDLVEAWYTKQIHHLPTWDRSFDQLLFISISVR